MRGIAFPSCLILTVCAAVDSIVVERVAVTEAAPGAAGKLQGTGLVCRFVGGLVAAAASGVLLNVVPPRAIFALTAAPFAVVAVAAAMSSEPASRDLAYTVISDDGFSGHELSFDEDETVHDRVCVSRRQLFRQRLCSLRDALLSRSILAPALFILVLNGTPSAGASMFYFWTEQLGFGPTFLSLCSIARYSAGALGAALFRKYFRGVPLRRGAHVPLPTLLAHLPPCSGPDDGRHPSS